MPDLLALSADFGVNISLNIPEVIPGNVMRATEANRTGGADIVPQVLRQLGRSARCGGFLAGANGKFVQRQLQDKGFNDYFVWCDGETSQNLIVTEANGRTTTIREQGMIVTPAHIQQMIKHLSEIPGWFKWVSFTGNIPPGASAEDYATLLDAARPAKTTVDGQSNILSVLAHHNLDLLCITGQEASHLLNSAVASVADTQRACEALVNWGNALVIIDLDEMGVVGFDGHECWHVIVPDVPAGSLPPSILMAGILDELIQGKPFTAALKGGATLWIAFKSGLNAPHRYALPPIVLQQLG